MGLELVCELKPGDRLLRQEERKAEKNCPLKKVSSRATGFSKSLRLSAAAEYSRVFDSASRSKDNSFVVLARANSKRIARLGLAVSKKHLRLAVQRNRVKRLIRESFREHQSALAGIDIVVLTQKNTPLKSTGELRESINAHWGKIKECTKS